MYVAWAKDSNRIHFHFYAEFQDIPMITPPSVSERNGYIPAFSAYIFLQASKLVQLVLIVFV